MSMVVISIIVVGFVFGFLVLGILLHRRKLTSTFEKAQEESKEILERARRDADRMVKTAVKDAKEETRKRRKVFEEETKRKKSEILKLERKIKQRENTLDSKLSSLETREEKLTRKEEDLQAEEKRKLRLIAEYEVNIERHQKTLEKAANMSADEARRELLSLLEQEARKESQVTIQKIEEQTRKEAQIKSQHIISLAVQRLAGEYVNDSTITVVNLPNEEMKGRIIGREGRNIRSLEQATGIDLIIDDTPEAVIISCFNPIRREIAKITLDRLIADGRIHPARIEETAKRVEEELDITIKEYGEQAAFDIGITDFHPEIIALLGKLRFRSEGLQSVLQHSVETAHICGMMAAEVGINVKRARRAGLLHDIGKAIGQDSEGHHAEVGSKICSKYGEHPDVIEAVRDHHAEDLFNAKPITVILGAANTLSGSRPGARKEVLDTYIKRLESMEDIIKGFEGIDSAYVLQAGREVRALVTPERLSDSEAAHLSNEIASKLRQELTFPGQVRITVVRESKYVEYAT